MTEIRTKAKRHFKQRDGVDLGHMRTCGTARDRQEGDCTFVDCIVVCEGSHFVEEKNESSRRHVEVWVVSRYLRTIFRYLLTWVEVQVRN